MKTINGRSIDPHKLTLNRHAARSTLLCRMQIHALAVSDILEMRYVSCTSSVHQLYTQSQVDQYFLFFIFKKNTKALVYKWCTLEVQQTYLFRNSWLLLWLISFSASTINLLTKYASPAVGSEFTQIDLTRSILL